MRARDRGRERQRGKTDSDSGGTLLQKVQSLVSKLFDARLARCRSCAGASSIWRSGVGGGGRWGRGRLGESTGALESRHQQLFARHDKTIK